MQKVLFICKKRPNTYGISYGLLNSCRFLVNALWDLGIEAKLIEVIDNNCIDKEVHHYKPSHVFIEALWVVPEKFEVLLPLHPTVKWFVRLHSNTPFIANEGIAIDWIKKYSLISKKYSNFNISPNSRKLQKDLQESLKIHCKYSPNIYQNNEDMIPLNPTLDDKIINISCFGAIRQLKNQLIQAMAAMRFANELNKTLHFHINYNRIESGGENIYRNLSALFIDTQHKLYIHEWMQHENFMKLVSTMDMGLQISLSETFNIIAADHVSLNVPCIGSTEIEWMNSIYKANPTDIDNIVSHMWAAWVGKSIGLQRLNKIGLNEYNHTAKKAWKKLLEA